MSTPHLYFLAGLGFDYRIFSNLNLNVDKKNVHHLDWLEPMIDESLSSYVMRITKQIDHSEPIILVGHSFGGVIVQEIAKILDPEKIIIISSVKNKSEIPITLKLLRIIPLYKLFNQKLVLRTFPIWARAFGYNSEKGRELFIQMISNCSDNYFRWSLDKIVHWEGNLDLKNVIHIHGSNDKTFFIKNIYNPIIIKDGSHFMVFSKAEEVSEVLNNVLK